MLMLKKASLALALILFAGSSFAASPATAPPGDSNKLPIYSFAVQSGGFRDSGLFMAAMHLRIPNTVWLCDLTYGNQGLITRCSAPSAIGSVAEVVTRVSCVSSDADTETIHLSTLDHGVYASVYIACRRDTDDGF